MDYYSRYQIERRIFQELLDLKRLQIRAGRANEHVLVKRMADEYSKSIASMVGLRKHDGPYTFKDFEKYLYGKTKKHQLMFFRLLTIYGGRLAQNSRLQTTSNIVWH